MLAQGAPQEIGRRASLLFVEVINLVEDEEQTRHRRPDPFEVGELGLGHRRIDREHEESCITFGQDLERRVGIVAQRRPDARGVDQDDAVAQDRRGVEHIDAGDP